MPPGFDTIIHHNIKELTMKIHDEFFIGLVFVDAVVGFEPT